MGHWLEDFLLAVFCKGGFDHHCNTRHYRTIGLSLVGNFSLFLIEVAVKVAPMGLMQSD
jgi:hypothetical protein